MADLAMEKEHLAKADRDIAEGERRVAQQAELIEHMRDKGVHGVPEAEGLLRTLRETLQAWRSHRENILKTIARIERGEFGSTPAAEPSG